MSSPTQKTEVKPAVHTVVKAVTFRESISFAAGEHNGVQVDRQVDVITAARLEPDCTPVAISTGQRADGLLLSRSVPARGTDEAYVSQYFVPFANVRGISYGK